MLPLTLAGVENVLCLGAHSDDIEIGCGGTLLRLLAARPDVVVHWVVFGAAGERAEEARRSAEGWLAGARVGQVAVHGFRDSYFPAHYGPVKEAMEALRASVRPDVIFTHHGDDLHQDHRVVAELTACAFRDHLILEYEIPKYDGDLSRPNLYVPLTEEVCQGKIDRLMGCFASQRSKDWFTPETFWGLLRMRGVECRAPYAEAFHARKVTVAW